MTHCVMTLPTRISAETWMVILTAMGNVVYPFPQENNFGTFDIFYKKLSWHLLERWVEYYLSDN